MLIAGAIGAGLVWGWLAARLAYRARWDVAVRVLLGLAALSLIIFQLTTARATLAFAGASALGALLSLAWARSLAARYRAGG
ncbi:MAG: hypothetical protein IPO81_12760 [Kouleothrix sp.]|nr:hypothetical protein [Kouleothrix sp.]